MPLGRVRRASKGILHTTGAEEIPTAETRASEIYATEIPAAEMRAAETCTAEMNAAEMPLQTRAREGMIKLVKSQSAHKTFDF